METVANATVGLVTVLLLHLLTPEMLFLTPPLARQIFNLTSDFAAASASLTTSPKFCNGFLTAALILASSSTWQRLRPTSSSVPACHG